MLCNSLEQSILSSSMFKWMVSIDYFSFSIWCATSDSDRTKLTPAAMRKKLISTLFFLSFDIVQRLFCSHNDASFCDVILI